jgi:crotonobetainyl-CoA:carnitine CoA-transferase CaiB-like acyl-CoA transferase
VTTDPPHPPKAALDELMVLDLSDSMAGAWCSRLFADFGADVTLVEAPSGHPLRAHAPVGEGGQSIPAAHALANKRSLALDLEAEPGRELLRDLITQADVVIESFAPGRLAEWRLDFETLEAIRPGLVLVSVTPHGQTSAYASVPGNSLTASARSGWASINGIAGRPPLQGSAYQSSYCTGVLAYAAALAALHDRVRRREEQVGEGQHVDISEFEVMASTFSPAALRAQYSGVPTPQKASMDVVSGPVPVKDGYFALTLSRAHFYRDAMTVLGLEDLAEDEQLQEGWFRQAHKELWVERVHEAMAGWDRAELFDELAVRRVVAGPVFGMGELMENEHLRARGFWTGVVENSRGLGRTGAPVKLSETPWRMRHNVQRVGEGTMLALFEYDIEDERARGLLESGVLFAEPAAGGDVAGGGAAADDAAAEGAVGAAAEGVAWAAAEGVVGAVAEGVAGAAGEGVAGPVAGGVAGAAGEGVAGAAGEGVAGPAAGGAVGAAGEGVASAAGEGVAGAAAEGVAGAAGEGAVGAAAEGVAGAAGEGAVGAAAEGVAGAAGDGVDGELVDGASVDGAAGSVGGGVS